MSNGTQLGPWLNRIKHVTQWKILGAYLNIDMSTLETIGDEQRDKVEKCKLQMLYKWLSLDPANPEREMTKALASYRKDSDSFSAGHHNDKTLIVDDVMSKRISSLRDTFSSLTRAAMKILRNEHETIDDAVEWLNGRLRGAIKEPLVVDKTVEGFQELSRYLHEHRWSITNTSLLEQLIGHRGDKELQDKMDDYSKAFSELKSDITTKTTTEGIVFSEFDSSKPCLILKITAERTSYDDIDVFLRDVLENYRHYMRVHEIYPEMKGITLQFPKNLTTPVQALINTKHGLIAKYGSMDILPVGQDPHPPLPPNTEAVITFKN